MKFLNGATCQCIVLNVGLYAKLNVFLYWVEKRVITHGKLPACILKDDDDAV